MEMIEKVAYLKGLAEGLGLDDSTKEGKVLGLVIDLLDDVVAALDYVEEDLQSMEEDLEAIEEELEEVFEDIYGDEDDDEQCCDCGCQSSSAIDYEGELYEVVCPACTDVVCVDEDMLDQGQISCPGCNETLEFDLEGALESEDLDN